LKPSWRSERGLFGTKLLIGLIILAILIAAAIDGGAILVTSFGVSDAAQQGSFDAAESYKTSREVKEARQAAATTVEDKGATLDRMVVNTQTGEVTVVVSKEAPTIFIQHLSFLPNWRHVEETDTAEAPP
jgi:Flp pilus assembly protein TadG